MLTDRTVTAIIEFHDNTSCFCQGSQYKLNIFFVFFSPLDCQYNVNFDKKSISHQNNSSAEMLLFTRVAFPQGWLSSVIQTSSLDLHKQSSRNPLTPNIFLASLHFAAEIKWTGQKSHLDKLAKLDQTQIFDDFIMFKISTCLTNPRMRNIIKNLIVVNMWTFMEVIYPEVVMCNVLQSTESEET